MEEFTYAVNPLVSGNGSTALPPLYQAHCSQAKLTVTVQNHGAIDTFQSFDLFWYNASSSTNGGYGLDYLRNGTIEYDWVTLDAAIYNMTLEYSYATNTSFKMQIRQYVMSDTDYWTPYAD